MIRPRRLLLGALVLASFIGPRLSYAVDPVILVEHWTNFR